MLALIKPKLFNEGTKKNNKEFVIVIIRKNFPGMLLQYLLRYLKGNLKERFDWNYDYVIKRL